MNREILYSCRFRRFFGACLICLNCSYCHKINLKNIKMRYLKLAPIGTYSDLLVYAIGMPKSQKQALLIYKKKDWWAWC